MGNKQKRLIVALLLLVLTLSLAACGRGKTGGDRTPGNTVQIDSDTVFVPEVLSLPHVEGTIRGGSMAGDTLFLLTADTAQETVEIAGYRFEENLTTWRICRTGINGEDAEEILVCPPPALPEDTSGSMVLSIMGPGGDGTLWVRENVTYYYYDFPENFDPARDRRSRFATDYVSETTYLLLDEAGSELRRIDAEQLAAFVPGSAADYRVRFDETGNVYLITSSGVSVLDQSCKLLFTIDAGEDLFINSGTVRLNDGSIAVECLIYSGLTGESEEQMRTIDLKKRGWGESWTIPFNAGGFFDGGGQFLFFYSSGDGLYGREADGDAARKLFSWFDTDLDQNSVQFLRSLPDGRLASMTRFWDNGSNPLVLAVLTEYLKSEAALPEKAVLTYGCWYLTSEGKYMIEQFNRTSEDCTIEVRDYLELSGGNYEAADLLMQTELLAGNVPDILALMGMPVNALEKSGYLEDLWPWIDADPEITREGLMIKPLEASARDGKLYRIFDRFSMRTIMGPTAVLGERTGWTLDEVKEAWAQMPEGTLLFSGYDTKSSVLSDLLSIYSDSFVNWETGECSFDSDEFKELLAFCDLFPLKQEKPSLHGLSDDVVERLYTGQQLLQTEIVSQFDSVQTSNAIYQGDVTYVGYPTVDGSCGSYFIVGTGAFFAMSGISEHKEEAWRFIRAALLPQYPDTGNGLGAYLPTNKADFEKIARLALRPTNQPWVISDYGFMTVAHGSITQEEYDQVMALYNAIERAPGSLTDLYDIINTHAGAYFSGDKSLDETASLIQSAARIYVNEQR